MNEKRDILKYSGLKMVWYYFRIILHHFGFMIPLGILIMGAFKGMFLDMALLIWVLIPASIWLLSQMVYNNGGGLDPLNGERMFYYMIDKEIGNIDYNIEYEETVLYPTNKMVFNPRSGMVYVSIGMLNRGGLRIFRDLRLISDILHEVRHITQLVEMGRREYENNLFNINEKDPKKNKIEYYQNKLEIDAYLYSWFNKYKYMSDYIHDRY